MSGAAPSPPTDPLLEIRNLTIRYRDGGRQINAVSDVSFALKPGGSLAIVGESGSGKSSVAGAVLDFLGPGAEVSGAIRFEGQDIAGLSPAQRRRMLGRRIGAVFQDPFTALNPALRVGRQIAEPMVEHLGLALPEALGRAEIALREMGIERAAEVARAFPHQLSGGMKQRALIAAALACGPSLLILDEPTTALDVTVEAQILRLLSRLRRETGVSLLFISHNLGVVRRLCDDVAVMLPVSSSSLAMCAACWSVRPTRTARGCSRRAHRSRRPRGAAASRRSLGRCRRTRHRTPAACSRPAARSTSCVAATLRNC